MSANARLTVAFRLGRAIEAVAVLANEELLTCQTQVVTKSGESHGDNTCRFPPFDCVDREIDRQIKSPGRPDAVFIH